jgi:hypothetical protein
LIVKTEKLKNPYTSSDLKRYIWAIARLGGWKGYLSERKPGITTFWIGGKNLQQSCKAVFFLEMCPDGSCHSGFYVFYIIEAIL